MLVYVRPHDLEVTRQSDGRPAWFARIHKLTRLGGLVRLELKLNDGTNLLVQLTRERSLELRLADGDQIYVVPKDLENLPGQARGIRARLRDLTSRSCHPGRLPVIRMITITLLWADGMGTSMFHLGIPILEKALRPILVYVFLVVLLRVFGKRELAQLNPFDLIVLLCLSNTLQNAMIGEDNSITGGLIGAFSLCAINYTVVRFLFKHRRLDELVEGRGTVLIKNGVVQRKALAAELLSESELRTIVHRQGFASLDEVQTCSLETGGTFSVEGKNPRRDDLEHRELLARIDGLARQMEGLKQDLASRGA